MGGLALLAGPLFWRAGPGGGGVVVVVVVAAVGRPLSAWCRRRVLRQLLGTMNRNKERDHFWLYMLALGVDPKSLDGAVLLER